MILEVECPVALIKVVGVHGGKGMLGAGKRIVIVGAEGREVRVGVVCVWMMHRGRGERVAELLIRPVKLLESQVGRESVVGVGPVPVVTIVREMTFVTVIVIVIVGAVMSMLVLLVKLVMRLEVRFGFLKACLEGHIHAVIHGGLSIDQACRA